MLYKKKTTSPYYYPNIVQIQVGDYLSTINYSEILDESCVEFAHVHGDYEIYYCLQGCMHLMINEECVALNENSFAVVNPGAFHHTVYEPLLKKNYYVFVFESPVLNIVKGKIAGKSGTSELVSKAIQFLKPNRDLVFTDRFDCRMIIDRLAREMESALPGYDQMISALYTEFLINIFRNFDVIEQEEKQRNVKPDNINMALELTQYMHDHYNQDIRVKDAAEYFHISERHLSRIFEKYFGKSFKHTLNVYRINYAKNYLLDTDYSLEKIAEFVGISSTKMFYRLFKEIENMTPTEFREQYKRDRSHYSL